jgi:hypothetical protein
MRSSTSPQIFSGERQEHVERVVDGALGRVLDRHDAEVRVAGLHFLEHLRRSK